MVLSRLISPAIHGGLKSARGAPGHPWPRAAHTTRESTMRTRPRLLGIVVAVTRVRGAGYLGFVVWGLSGGGWGKDLQSFG